jgi:predicted DNA-binding protein
MKIGRPPSKNPKKYDTRIRMSEDDIQKLEFCSKTANLTKAAVIRKGIDEVYEKLKKK